LGGCNAYDAEGHAEKLLNRAQTKIEKKAGLSGDGLYQTGNGMIMTGNGMFQAGRGSTFVTQPLMTPGIPKGSTMVGQATTALRLLRAPHGELLWYDIMRHINEGWSCHIY
jgi:hypothetical protein